MSGLFHLQLCALVKYYYPPCIMLSTNVFCFHIFSTSRLIFGVFLQIMCKGNIVHSGNHTQHHTYVQEVAPLPPTTAPTTAPTPAPTTLKLTTVASKENRTANVSLNATDTVIIKEIVIPAIWPPWRPPTPPPLKDLPKPVVEQFEIKFPVTIKMVPKCRILVYYVRGDKETVADSMEYDVEDVLENQVRQFDHHVKVMVSLITMPIR